MKRHIPTNFKSIQFSHVDNFPLLLITRYPADDSFLVVGLAVAVHLALELVQSELGIGTLCILLGSLVAVRKLYVHVFMPLPFFQTIVVAALNPNLGREKSESSLKSFESTVKIVRILSISQPELESYRQRRLKVLRQLYILSQ